MDHTETDILRTPLDRMPSRIAVPMLHPRRIDFRLRVRPPGSKSLTNRALLLAALAEGESILERPLTEADDVVQMVAALRTLGATIDDSDPSRWRITGVGGQWTPRSPAAELFINNAGTAARFLAAAALLAPIPVTLDGSERMRQRPIGALGELLERLGAKVEYLGKPGCLPLRIARPLPDPSVNGAADGRLRPPPILEVPQAESSQFVSALLLASPWFAAPLTIRHTGEVTSASYVSMTLGLLSRLGAAVHHSIDLRVVRAGADLGDGGRTGLRAFHYAVEPDASGATYFWAAAAMFPGAVCRVEGLGERSLQGDAAFPTMLERMGAGASSAAEPAESSVTGGPAIAPIIADMSDMPDAVMTLAVVAAFATGTSVIRGVRTLRFKESDRVEALRCELRKIGVGVESPVDGDEDVMRIIPPPAGVDCSASAPPVVFETYNDHRMAMSLSLVGLRRPNVQIDDPACVAKTYPEFWRHLAMVYQPAPLNAGRTTERT